MQKVGQFQLGETFHYAELTQMYDSLVLLKDLCARKQTLYVGIS